MKRLILLTYVLMHSFILKVSAQENAPTVNFQGGNICQTEPWKLVFHDEFDGDELDTDKWYTFFPYGPNNSDQCAFCRTHDGSITQQIFLDENLSVNNGILKMMIKEQEATWFNESRDYTSGVINSKQVFTTYTKYEIRCKIPSGVGFWPAFWVFGWSTEIDVFEFGGHEPNMPHTTIHKWIDGESVFKVFSNYTGDDYSQDFHTFAVEYDPFFIKLLIDGSVKHKFSRYFTLDGNAVVACNIPPDVYLQNPAYPRWGDHVQIIAGPGVSVDGGPFTDAPNESTVFPSSMEVDYIRVYQRQPQGGLFDLCNFQIIGDKSICRQIEYNYYFDNSESINDIHWTSSDNLTILQVNNNEITITSDAENEEEGWIQVEIKGIEKFCPGNIFKIDITINPDAPEFNIVELFPACFPHTNPQGRFITVPLTEVQWEVNNGAISPPTGSFTIVDPNSEGWFTLTATSNNICNESFTTVSRNFYAEPCIRNFGMLTINPNPSDHIINIEFQHTFNTSETFDISVINSIYEVKYLTTTDQNYLQIDVSNYNPGIYWVFIQREDRQVSAPFVVY